VVDLPAVNASPLIFLGRAGLLDLLQLAAPEVVVPMQVAEEIGRRDPQDLTAQAIESTSWLRAVEIAAIPQAIQSAQTVVGRLRQSGMYLSDGVVARALALVGE